MEPTIILTVAALAALVVLAVTLGNVLGKRSGERLVAAIHRRDERIIDATIAAMVSLELGADDDERKAGTDE